MKIVSFSYLPFNSTIGGPYSIQRYRCGDGGGADGSGKDEDEAEL